MSKNVIADSSSFYLPIAGSDSILSKIEGKKMK